MEFNKAHLTIIDNLQLALRKCELPGAKGEEMLALAQGYHFLSYMKQFVENQVREQQIKAAAEQALASAQPVALGLESSLSEVLEKPKARKHKSEG